MAKFKPSPAMIAAMRAGMAKASQTPKPTPPQASAPLPICELTNQSESEHPLAHRWAIQAFRLSPSKHSYFAVLRESFFSVVRQCGDNPLAFSRHIVDLYKVPQGTKRVDDILSEKPIASAFSPAFYFLDEHAAYQATLKTIQTELI